MYTYAQLLHEVEKAAAALRGMGIGKGDRITIYMPTSPEAIILMLAAVRIGAIHVVVFAGFGARALGDRIRASGSKLVFTTDITFRKGKEVHLKGIVDAALEGEPHSVEKVVVLARTQAGKTSGARDVPWEEFLAMGAGQSGAHVEMESNEPAFILATSGTTAKPKLAVHTHGGYQVHIASMGRWVFGLKPSDVWWSTSDIGWVVGHSYIVYAPLLAGCTTLAYEGAIDHPAPDTLWKIVEEFGVTGIFTSPTAVRLLMRYGEEPARRADLSSLEKVFCAGEVLNAPAWDWLQNRVLGGRVPVIDHMWQTETAGPVFGNPYGIAMLPIKPGSAAIPLPGISCEVVGPEGEPCKAGREGDHGHQAAVPRPDADSVGRAGAVRRATTGSDLPACTTRATPPTWTRTATSGSPAAPTRSSRSPATGSARSRSRRHASSIPRSPRPGARDAPTSCAARSSRHSWS